MMALMPLMMHLDELTPHSSPKVLMSFIRSLEHFISAASSIGIDVTDHSDPILQMMYASSDFNEVLDTARQLIERYRPLKISNDAMNFIYGGKNEI